MALLHLLSFLLLLIALAFILLCLASGLLYVTEIIEEHSQLAKKIGRQIIHVIIFFHLAFYLSDGLPLGLTLLGVTCHLVYLSNFSNSWPIISLTSPSFIASSLLVMVDHFAWFFYFTDRAKHLAHHQASYHQQPSWDHHFTVKSPPVDPLTFLDVTTFFALCVWLVPFFLFLSLSANDNVLPTLNPELPTPISISAQPPTPTTDVQELSYDPTKLPLHQPNFILQPPRASLLKGLLQSCLTSLPHIRRHPLQLGGRTSSRPNEGLIASPSISCPSSPYSAVPSSLLPSTPNLSGTSTSFSLTGRTPPSSPSSPANSSSPRRTLNPSSAVSSPTPQKRSTSLRERPSSHSGPSPSRKRFANPSPSARVNVFYNSTFSSTTILTPSA